MESRTNYKNSLHKSPAESSPKAAPSSQHALETLEKSTRQVKASSLSGIKTLRVLNESRFLSVMESLVEKQIREALENSTPDSRDEIREMREDHERSLKRLEEDYQKRWDAFRAHFDGKLRNLEEMIPDGPSDLSRPSR